MLQADLERLRDEHGQLRALVFLAAKLLRKNGIDERPVRESDVARQRFAQAKKMGLAPESPKAKGMNPPPGRPAEPALEVYRPREGFAMQRLIVSPNHCIASRFVATGSARKWPEVV